MAKQIKGRKFFAATASAALVASAIVPVASAAELKDAGKIPTWAQEAVQALVEGKVIEGDQNGYFNPGGTVTRAVAAQILTKALDLPTTGTENFSDVKEGAWYYDAVVATSNAGIFKGNDLGQFDPNGLLTREQAASVIVRAFGLEGSADLSKFADADKVAGWAKEDMAIAVANGVIKGNGSELNPKASITRAEIAVMVHRTIEGENTDPVETELKVESVSAINANQILVTYNQKVEKESAEDLGNYLFEGKISTSTSSHTARLNDAGVFSHTPRAFLQDDGKSVLLVLDTNGDNTIQVLQGQVKQKLTIENIKSDTGLDLAKTAIEFNHIDTTVPKVESVTTEGNRVIVVKFSEFVKPEAALDARNYQINNVSLTAYGAGKGQYDYETNTVRFIVSSALADNTYTFKYSVDNAIEDAADFKVVEGTQELTIKADTSVPKVQSVEVVKPSTGTDYILVKFSKPLAQTDDYVKGSPVTVDGTAYNANMSVENGALKIEHADVAKNGAHAVNIVNNDNNYLVDAYGIKVEAGSITYTVKVDTEKPTVKSTTVKEGNKEIEIKFSERLDLRTATNRLNYTIKNDKGDSQVIESATFKSGTTDTVVLKLNETLKAGKFTLDVKNVRDLADPANTMDAYSTTLTVVDTVKPTVESVEYADTTVYVTFSEDMNTSTITNKDNYLFDNKALPSDAKVTAISNTVAKIEFAANTIVANKKFAVSTGATDVAGNPLSGFGYETTIVTPFTVKSLDVDAVNKVERTDKYKVSVKLNKALELLDATEFDYSVDNGTTWVSFTQQNASFTTKDGKSTIVFTLDKDKEGNAGKDKVEEILFNHTANTNIKIRTNVNTATTESKTKATDGSRLSGTLLNTSGITVQDKVAPAVFITNDTSDPKEYDVVAKDIDNNGKIDRIVVTFTEALKPGSVSTDDFEVTGLEVSDVAVDDNKVTLKLKEGKVNDASDTFTITLKGDIEDVAGNVLKADTSKFYTAKTELAATAGLTYAGVLQIGETTTLAAPTGQDSAVTTGGSQTYALDNDATTAAGAAINTSTGAVTDVAGAGNIVIKYVGKNAAGEVVETQTITIPVYAAAATNNPTVSGAYTAGSPAVTPSLTTTATDKRFTIGTVTPGMAGLVAGDITLSATTGEFSVAAGKEGSFVIEYVGKDANGVVVDRGSVTVTVNP